MSKKITVNEMINLTTERNHILIDPEKFSKNYKNVKSKITINCQICKYIFETTVHSYKNAKKTGCPSCKKTVASITHRNKEVSLSTRQLIGYKATLRQGSLTGKYGKDHPRFKNAKGRDITKRSTNDYKWINAIKKIYNKKCVLTGISTEIVCHHLDAWNLFPEKRYL